MPNFVYVLTIPTMPGLVKIGYTNQDDVRVRIADLYRTGVPVPFQIEYVCRVENAQAVENALHIAFRPNRINPNREFFKIDPEQAIVILKLFRDEDITEEVIQQPSGIDQESMAATENLISRRPRLNFEEMHIPVGSVLNSTHDERTVVVTSPNQVRLGEEEMSLSAATKQVLGLGYNVRPIHHWTFNGISLRKIYSETYEEE